MIIYRERYVLIIYTDEETWSREILFVYIEI